MRVFHKHKRYLILVSLMFWPIVASAQCQLVSNSGEELDISDVPVPDEMKVQQAMQLLRSSDPAARETGAGRVGYYREIRSVPYLVEFVRTTHSDSPSIRGTALFALRRIYFHKADKATPVAVAAIEEFLEHSEGEYDSDRRDALKLLGELGRSSSIPILIQSLLSASDWGGRNNAAQSLGCFKDARAIDALSRAALGDDDVLVRVSAIESLDDIKDTRGVPALVAALNLPADKNPLIPSLLCPSWYASVALGEMSDKSAVPALVKATHDPGTRWPAALALEMIGDTRGRSTVAALLPDEQLTQLSRGFVAVIKRGEPGTKGPLLLALERFRSKQMAETLVDCGDDEIAQAVRVWAAARHIKLEDGGGVHVVWGEQ